MYDIQRGATGHILACLVACDRTGQGACVWRRAAPVVWPVLGLFLACDLACVLACVWPVLEA